VLNVTILHVVGDELHRVWLTLHT